MVIDIQSFCLSVFGNDRSVNLLLSVFVFCIFLHSCRNVRYRDAQKAFAQLEKSGCRILGAVLNKIDTSGDKYYSSYYKHYGEYYRRDEDDSEE